MTHILVDAHNLFFRARHVVRGDDIETKTGMAMHIIFNSVNRVWRDLNGSHVVFAFDGRSWRRDMYPRYKGQRRDARKEMTPKEVEEDQAFFEAFNSFRDFLREKTNVTVLHEDGCEADDFIAHWIQMHPDQDHVIVSSDSDFYQLISERVSQFNGITAQHIKIDGVFDERGRPVIDKKTKEQKQIGDPEWLLFEKCIRGDSADNIFSAFPGARKKGTKNRVGMVEAFEDRHNRGYNWNNFLLQRWVDHEGEEHRVLDDYNFNRKLIDLTQQPDEIKEIMNQAILDAVQIEPQGKVGLNLMKFCGQHNLVKIGEQATDHAAYLGATYG